MRFDVPRRRLVKAEDETGAVESGSSGGPGSGRAAALVVAAILLLAALVILVEQSSPGLGWPDFLSRLASLVRVSLGGGSTSTIDLSLYSPLIQNGSASIAYPSNYEALASYALELINKDRADFNLTSVQLSPVPAAQQHVDSMLRYGYFSHFDTQGLAPYMRYTLLGGRGAVEENVAYLSDRPGHFSSLGSVEVAVKFLERSMMYNDSACCNNGHRDNILNPLHTRVSIGIAYNFTTVFFAEDFESYYVDLNFTVSAGYSVSMTGTPLLGAVRATEVLVTYDPPPSNETPSELNAGPNEYGPGTLLGGVLPPCSFVCPRFERGITEYATSWKFTPTQSEIVFPLSEFVKQHGAGTYTLYLLTGSDTDSAVTSISVFVHK